jgi:hypothetical protein
MKKAKIFLTALTVLAVVGGALAFKLTPDQQIGKCDTSLPVPKCSLDPIFSTFATSPTGQVIEYDFVGNNCFKLPSGLYTCTTKTVIE